MTIQERCYLFFAKRLFRLRGFSTMIFYYGEKSCVQGVSFCGRDDKELTQKLMEIASYEHPLTPPEDVPK
jgi:hypothetical protein